MKNYEKEIYAFQDVDGNLIGIDREYGGYPWTPDSISQVWLTNNKEAAIRYSKTTRQLTLVKVKITVEPVE